jgi:hypothetical protein
VTLHLIKLCVGADTMAELAAYPKSRAARRKKDGSPGDILHVTRMTPKREDELLKGGSLYWVVKGQIAVRQKLLELRAVTKNGIPHCALVLDPKLVPVERRVHRAFQGWRYLDPKDAPKDLKGRAKAAIPEALHAELAQLGLL